MKIKIFLCGTEADKRYLNKIKRWCKHRKCGQHYFTFVTPEDSPAPRPKRRLQLANTPPPPPERTLSIPQKLKYAQLALILLGNDNDNHPWLEYDNLALQFNLPRYYMRVPYTTDPVPPRIAEVRQIAYNPNAIDKLLRAFEADHPEWATQPRIHFPAHQSPPIEANSQEAQASHLDVQSDRLDDEADTQTKE